MQESKKGSRAALFVFIAGVSAALLFVGLRAWLVKTESRQDGLELPASSAPAAASSSTESLSSKPTEPARIIVDVQPTSTEGPQGAPEPATATEEPVDTSETSAVADDHFAYVGRTPDWVFEQKYGGMTPEEIQTAKETIQAEYKLVSLKAFNEQFDAGNFEVIPAGQPPVGVPGDERLISGRSMPNSPDTRLARLEFDQYPQVYELWFEYLWLATQR